MFAVTGWNVPGQAKAGTASKKQLQAALAAEDGKPAEAAEPSKKKSKKNKKKKEGLEINAQNLSEVYEQVIEGKAPVLEMQGKKRKLEGGEERKSKKEKKIREKGVKHEATTNTTATEEEEITEKPAEETTREPTKTKSKPKKTDAAVATETVKLTPLQQKMREKLTSARFRHINELLYTTPSEQALDKFKAEPDLFDEYHVGFRRQVEVWPENPVEIFLATLRQRAELRFEKGDRRKRMGGGVAGSELPLPRDEDLVCTVADLGCGDAKIAHEIRDSPLAYNSKKKYANKGKIKVLSYDLKSVNDLVTAADIAHLPLENETVDIAIFCLALMGTNFLDFIEEAYRILRYGGELWIAEIKSRFNAPGSTAKKSKAKEEELANKGRIGVRKVGKDDADLEDNNSGITDHTWKGFVEALARRGFVLRGNVDASNKMFVRMEFVKADKREWRRNNDDSDASDDSEDDRGKRGGRHQMMSKKKTKFLEETEEMIKKREAALLKPCVYKLR